MNKFKIGDRVRVVKGVGDADYILGETGTIKSPPGVDDDYAVEFDKQLPWGHTCQGACSNSHGRWVRESALALTSDCDKIVIVFDGAETTARLYQGKTVVKKAAVRCAPDDTYDQRIGAVVALARLYDGKIEIAEDGRVKGVFGTPEDKPKYFNGRAVCVAAAPNCALTVGKIYTFEDGVAENDSRPGRITCWPIASVEELNEMFIHTKFLEVKE